ncbi:uncharacterized protein LOC128731128 [Anopheles nili]|uniref:uncharacterized protein LOC128731128 n=1 Tax=Anopheles nili TaxID=185578 RepID=UPI00237C0144|nr:uncharacterized protein LOC128731128 [Anopheles nili]
MTNAAKEYSALIKEQRQLKKAESTLIAMIDKINQELNQLVVEELQLKSRDAQLSVKATRSQVDVATCSTAEINQQVLNLDVQDNRFKKSLEESEDEL